MDSTSCALRRETKKRGSRTSRRHKPFSEREKRRAWLRAARKLRGKFWCALVLMGMQGRGGFSNRRSADMEGGNAGMFGTSGGNKGGATKNPSSIFHLQSRLFSTGRKEPPTPLRFTWTLFCVIYSSTFQGLGVPPQCLHGGTNHDSK